MSEHQPGRDAVPAQPASAVAVAAPRGVAPAGGRLCDLDFTDLFFSERGEAFARGMEDGDGPLVGIPPAVVADLDRLHRQVCDKGQTHVEFFLDYDSMRFRVSKIEDVEGVWYTLRRAKWPIPRLGELGGMPQRVMDYLGYIGKPGKHGLLLIAGATSQGKTTTACSLLQEYLLHYGDVAVTVEDPVELPLNGPHGRFGHCFQTQVEDGDFGTAMKRTMRRAPRYILLGEIRAPEEASQAIRAAINGHLVISTIHAGSCIEAINACVKFVAGKEPLDLARTILADGLVGVVHQRLVRVKGKGRMLKLEYLFPGDNKGIRTLIRSGKTEQLVTQLEAQAARVAQGKPPMGE
jgi:twitching motility protein PilT